MAGAANTKEGIGLTMTSSPQSNRPAPRSATPRPFGLRTWSTPLTMGSFLLMAITGILMFFDVVPGYIAFAHEWFSWLFLLGAAGHMVVNIRALNKHLQSNWGRANVVIFTLVLVASTFSFGRITAPQLKWPISNALVEAPLTALADVTRTDTAELLARLQAHGITAKPNQSIKELSEVQDLDEFHVLGLIFLSEGRRSRD